jgi:hypothetical protein
VAAPDGRSRRSGLLWVGAVATALAPVFFPRIRGIRDRDESWWSLLWFVVPQDLEGAILVPLVILMTIGLFAFAVAGRGGKTSRRNRRATVGLVCSVLGVAAVVVVFLSGRSSSVRHRIGE